VLEEVNRWAVELLQITVSLAEYPHTLSEMILSVSPESPRWGMSQSLSLVGTQYM